MKLLRIVCFLIFTFAIYRPAQSQIVYGDPDAWTYLMTYFKFDSNWTGGFELHYRTTNFFKEREQFLIRPQIIYNQNSNVSYGLGYVYSRVFPYGLYPLPAVREENNLWQQVVLKFKLGKTEVHNRYRLEERFWQVYDNASNSYNYNQVDYSNRFRYRLAFNIPLSKKFNLLLMDEIMLSINKNFTVVDFNQNRFNAGIDYIINDQWTFQTSYMFHYTRRTDQVFERHNTWVIGLIFMMWTNPNH